MLIDGHLDLAFNAMEGRDLTLPLEQLRTKDPLLGQTATVSFPELRAANLRLCFGTLFSWPYSPNAPAGYTDAEGARRQALKQLEHYLRWQDCGLIRLLLSRTEIVDHLQKDTGMLGVVLLMEGADPIRDVDDLEFWTRQGVRIIGPAWERTRYAGGTDSPGPLTDAGKELVQAMKELHLTLDASHLDDEAFWDAVEIGPRMIASHSNSRSLVPGKNRHLTDDMVKAIAATDGVIGLVTLNRFIDASWTKDSGRTSLSELVKHAEHYAQLVGWDRVALGTDMDGGFGNERTPQGIDRYSDLQKWIACLPAEHQGKVAWKNWARWLRSYF